MKFESQSVYVEPDKEAPPDHKMVVCGQIPIQDLTKSKVGGVGGVCTDCDPAGDDVPVIHQNVDPLIPLEDKVESVTFAEDPGCPGDSILLQNEGSRWLHKPEPPQPPHTAHKEVEQLIFFLFGGALECHFKYCWILRSDSFQSDSSPRVSDQTPG